MGFIISQNKPFLGASPDNITKCKCTPKCKSVVVEFKCPWSHKDADPKEAFLQPEIGGLLANGKFALKSTSRYYYQVQITMFTAELGYCHFVVWTTRGIFCHTIAYDPIFEETIALKLELFWVSKVVPQMLENLQGYQ